MFQINISDSVFYNNSVYYDESNRDSKSGKGGSIFFASSHHTKLLPRSITTFFEILLQIAQETQKEGYFISMDKP